MKKSTLLASVLLSFCLTSALQAQLPTFEESLASAETSPMKEAGTVLSGPSYDPRGAEGLSAPAFAGLENYIAAHLVYPEVARENGLEGRVRLRLSIGADGRVEDAEVVDGLGLGCDEAARALALNMPAWTPATQSGIPVRSRAMIALNFRIR